MDHKLSYPHLISLDILPRPLIKDIRILIILCMPTCGHSPNGILQTHGRFSHRSTVKGLIVPTRVNYRNEMIMCEKEDVVAKGKRITKVR